MVRSRFHKVHLLKTVINKLAHLVITIIKSLSQLYVLMLKPIFLPRLHVNIHYITISYNLFPIWVVLIHLHLNEINCSASSVCINRCNTWVPQVPELGKLLLETIVCDLSLIQPSKYTYFSNKPPFVHTISWCWKGEKEKKQDKSSLS